MTLKKISLAIGISLSVFPLLVNADSSLNSIEARLNALEKRAVEAEYRATSAEQKVVRLEQLMTKGSTSVKNANSVNIEQRISTLEKNSDQAQANAILAERKVNDLEQQQKVAVKSNSFVVNNSGWGKLKLYGDVEYNIDAASRKGQITSMHTQAGKKNNNDKERWDLNGRILIGLDGERSLTNGNYAGFKVQPLANMSGNMGLDDAVFYFGKNNKWNYKIGRYEAYDMFPLNQDTFVEHSGNSANDLYSDGFGYVYMMKEGRGRSNNGGAMNLSSTYNDWYFEVNTLVEDGSKVFKNEQYHGRKLDNRKNVVYVRPVVAWKKDNFTIAGAIDANIVRNAYGFNNADGKFEDQSRRTGYGLTLKWDNLKDKGENGIIANLSTAYLDAKQESDFSAGGNILWRKLQVGYIYAHNDIKSYQRGNDINIDQNEVLRPGKYDIHTLFTSYELPNVLEIDNFKTYLGAYYSYMNGRGEMTSLESKDKERYGARIRFKYLF
ncbi:carbohydrate porin [Pectobacterium wasabiae]|uniref:Porin n=1 Tax=Pectobacterium wasabiae TaxID=55208 RepID=A0AAW3EJM8_9GAMM|nr:carbohydrate porin [Pectobacterium wasabiae]AOR63818.1 porin [Pectobacterium wasabiae CFBP 3304]EJS94205.1 Putative glycoporin [Pectobacterium wasabiae CFBP 3304]KFX08441.1 porin [Pectobacterium wasabiae]KGA28468.1 porin [Pectobacterium wasabiae]